MTSLFDFILDIIQLAGCAYGAYAVIWKIPRLEREIAAQKAQR